MPIYLIIVILNIFKVSSYKLMLCTFTKKKHVFTSKYKKSEAGGCFKNPGSISNMKFLFNKPFNF